MFWVIERVLAHFENYWVANVACRRPLISVPVLNDSTSAFDIVLANLAKKQGASISHSYRNNAVFDLQYLDLVSDQRQQSYQIRAITAAHTGHERGQPVV